MGGTGAERKNRRKEEEEGRKESAELTRTPGFMGRTQQKEREDKGKKRKEGKRALNSAGLQD